MNVFTSPTFPTKSPKNENIEQGSFQNNKFSVFLLRISIVHSLSKITNSREYQESRLYTDISQGENRIFYITIIN